MTPILSALHEEYRERYGPEVADRELARVVADEVGPPGGDLVVVVEDGVTVAGGAYRRLDDRTVEVKRMWTAAPHRRRGLARRVLAALEESARVRGFRRVELTTGWNQPEAVALYAAAGYTPTDAGPGSRLRPFAKDLG